MLFGSFDIIDLMSILNRVGVVLLGFFIIFGISSVALAVDNESPIKSFDDVIKVLQKALNWFATAFWIFAVGGSLYAGFLYMTAAGSQERVQKAKKQMIYVVIAIIIGLLAYGLPTILKNILTPSNANGNGNSPVGAQCISASDCTCDYFSTPQCLAGQCFCN